MRFARAILVPHGHRALLDAESLTIHEKPSPPSWPFLRHRAEPRSGVLRKLHFVTFVPLAFQDVGKIAADSGDLNLKTITSLSPLLSLMMTTVIAAESGQVLSPEARIDGKSQAEWSRLWWQWAASFQYDESPVADQTGQNCQEKTEWSRVLSGRHLRFESDDSQMRRTRRQVHIFSPDKLHRHAMFERLSCQSAPTAGAKKLKTWSAPQPTILRCSFSKSTESESAICSCTVKPVQNASTWPTWPTLRYMFIHQRRMAIMRC